MAEHVRTQHIKLWACHLCDEQFKQKARLENHLKDLHDGPLDCNVSVDDRSTLYFPSPCAGQFYSTLKYYTCTCTCKSLCFVLQICGRTCSSMTMHQIHMQREHSDVKRHFCGTCKEGFYEKNDMIEHRFVLRMVAHSVTLKCDTRSDAWF